jgi:hypothetical protein
MLLTVRVSPRLTAERAMVWLDCGASITVLLLRALPPLREIRLTVI